MKVVQFASYGDPDVLQYTDAPQPVVGEGTVRIKVAAAGVNPADYKWREGMFSQFAPVHLPHVLGYDIAGHIDGVGDGVVGFNVGNRVVAMLDPFLKGGYAEYAVIDAANVAHVPDALDLDVAAGLPTPALSGVQLIEEHVRPQPGETVLITGAVGAVGRFAVHTAHRLGASVIAAVRESHLKAARALGVSQAIVLGAETDLHFDHVADVVGGKDVAELCRRLPASARIITLATTPIDPEGLASTPTFVAVHPNGTQLDAICKLVADGTIEVAPIQAMPLSDAAAAHKLLAAGGLHQKLVLHP